MRLLTTFFYYFLCRELCRIKVSQMYLTMGADVNHACLHCHKIHTIKTKMDNIIDWLFVSTIHHLVYIALSSSSSEGWSSSLPHVRLSIMSSQSTSSLMTWSEAIIVVSSTMAMFVVLDSSCLLSSSSDSSSLPPGRDKESRITDIGDPMHGAISTTCCSRAFATGCSVGSLHWSWNGRCSPFSCCHLVCARAWQLVVVVTLDLDDLFKNQLEWVQTFLLVLRGRLDRLSLQQQWDHQCNVAADLPVLLGI